MGKNTLPLGFAFALGWLAGWGPPAQALHAADETPIDQQIGVILAIDKEGAGNEKGTAAWEQLASRDAYAIPALLGAIDRANPIAANYLRSAVDAVAERALHENSPMPAGEFEKFLADTEHLPRSRRLAFELLASVDPSAKDRWIPKFLLDPSPELRREGVAYWVGQAEAALADGKNQEALALFQKALQGAVDEDQTKSISKRMEELGEKVDLATHFGLVQDWKVIGPFDNTGEKGFDVVYPPETVLDFAAKYPGKNGEVAWKDYITKDAMGTLDLLEAIEQGKGVIAYAVTNFRLDAPRQAQIRFGTPNGWKLWVNGELIFARDEYHSGNQFDQYSYDVDLKAGDNLVLFKCCQNEQTETWTNVWGFQLRVCDSSGTAVLATNRPDVVEDPPKPEEED